MCASRKINIPPPRGGHSLDSRWQKTESGLVQCEIWSVYVCKCACVFVPVWLREPLYLCSHSWEILYKVYILLSSPNVQYNIVKHFFLILRYGKQWKDLCVSLCTDEQEGIRNDVSEVELGQEWGVIRRSDRCLGIAKVPSNTCSGV